MVMGIFNRKQESLIFDYIHRRNANSEGIINYAKTIIVIHDDRTTALFAAKDDGRTVQKRILQIMKCTILPLCHRFDRISLVFIHENNFDDANEGYKHRKVILFAAHP